MSSTLDTIFDQMLQGAPPTRQIKILAFEAACWNAALRVYNRVDLRPEERDLFDNEEFYWQKCSFLSECMRKLGALCRDHNIDISQNAFFALLDSHWKNRFYELYNFRRRVTYEKLSLAQFIDSIENENRISFKGWTFSPGGYHEYDDDYGVPFYTREWWYKNDGGMAYSIPRFDAYQIIEWYKKITDVNVSQKELSMVETQLNFFRTYAEAYQEEDL